MLKRRQKSSPLSPRFGRRVSSELPRMIGLVAKVTSRGEDDCLGGRAKAGVMGVIGGWSGWGVLGTEGAMKAACGLRGPNEEETVIGLVLTWYIWSCWRPCGVAVGSGRVRLSAATGAAYPGLGAAIGNEGCVDGPGRSWGGIAGARGDEGVRIVTGGWLDVSSSESSSASPNIRSMPSAPMPDCL